MNCSGCFKEVAVDGYCKKCLKELFDGEKVSYILPFHSPYTEDSDLFNDMTKQMSISGFQEKS